MIRADKSLSQRILNSEVFATLTSLYFLFPFRKGLKPKPLSTMFVVIVALVATPLIISNIKGKLSAPQTIQTSKYKLYLETGIPLTFRYGETKNGIHSDYVIPNPEGQVAYQNAIISTAEMVRNFVRDNPDLRWVELRRALQMKHSEFNLVMAFLRKEGLIEKHTLGQHKVYKVVS
jgi:hypothetical protein